MSTPELFALRYIASAASTARSRSALSAPPQPPDASATTVSAIAQLRPFITPSIAG
jgi:hypothetical protein